MVSSQERDGKEEDDLDFEDAGGDIGGMMDEVDLEGPSAASPDINHSEHPVELGYSSLYKGGASRKSIESDAGTTEEAEHELGSPLQQTSPKHPRQPPAPVQNGDSLARTLSHSSASHKISRSASPRTTSPRPTSPRAHLDRPLPRRPPQPLDHQPPDNPHAPFQSIPLAEDPLPASIPLPLSPNPNRKSWTTFSLPVNGNGHSRSSSAASNPQIHVPAGEAIEDSTPRFQAPPAHPHPAFPPESSSNPASTSSGPSGSRGPKAATSAFEAVVSRTRPSWLPPKDRVEDESHLAEWETMMAHSRAAEAERRRTSEMRMLEREKKLAVAVPRWEGLLTGFTTEKVRGDEGLRQLWFEGVPSHLRGKAWSAAIGNPLAMSKEAYKSYLSRARKALESHRFPIPALEAMEADLDTTIPHLRLFTPGSPMRAELRDFVCAWIVYRSDEGRGYADMFPKIYANLSNLSVRIPQSWIRTLLVEWIPFEAVCRLWDQIMLEGDGYLFRAMLAIIAFLEPRLHFPDRAELESVLEGRNPAVLAIQARERERARLRGEVYDDVGDGKMSVFNLTEEAIFRYLETDGWRWERYERLILREMPD